MIPRAASLFLRRQGLSALALLVMLAATAGFAARRQASRLAVGNPQAAELPGLHNVFHLSEKLYSGSVPEGEAGFRSLRELGIRTILTVDGAPPDVALAKQYGLRYAHLPFGYDGCPVPTANAVVRAVRDLPGPIYLHCHHGKNRAPAAAAFARIALDGISNEQAMKEMERAGAGKQYTGLYGSVRAFRRPSEAELARVSPRFPELAPTPPLMTGMALLDARFGRLLQLQKAGWKAPAGQDDLNPAHEALQLRELFAELNRTPEVRARPGDFRASMTASEQDAAALEGALRAQQPDDAGRFLGRLAARCAGCHSKYRDMPQP